ncbi:ABC transporter permease [Pelagibacterium sp. 26DY04]|uniref:ABC transporter permease n=1 Tax=Pelagibacterium sp. 26DY04 TaxID=2967130 RepID=UPI002814A828|nr:ABC transporter permease [Pelagibacterium sp. 26DY04]WMT88430.1 ABC transporter permease [Pelagibacterium sp. 26DY04]
MAEFFLRRLVLMIFTVIAISIVSYAIIALPPGDYVDKVVADARKVGDVMTASEIDALRTQLGLDRSLPEQYLSWIWGIVTRGDFGRSFFWEVPVSEIIWQRLGMTTLLSVLTLVFIWVVAIPIGIYSAVKKYSLGDYVFTTAGFIGLAIPNFLLALILLYISFRYMGQSVGGLFSPEYVNAPWSLGKVLDLISHLWIPMVVLGTAGTASVIRTIRANLLDELHKPYVLTARAKGLEERRLTLKYPVRYSLNPFVSGLNDIFVTIISGETIVAVVLGLQTTGPLLLDALRGQDMYLAATLIMFLSFLAVLGTLFSDVLLMALDPRIRRQAREGEVL